jgi:hypothetical protein
VTQFTGHKRLKNILLELAGWIGQSERNFDNSRFVWKVEIRSEGSFAAESALTVINSKSHERPITQFTHERVRGAIAVTGTEHLLKFGLARGELSGKRD